MNEEIPKVFYFYLHSMIKKRELNLAEEMSVKDFYSRMFQWRVPTCLKPLILKEMILLGLVKEIDSKKVELCPSCFNINDLRELYQKLGIY
jgi:hypothetical protein